jgi:hypothetical protein
LSSFLREFASAELLIVLSTTVRAETEKPVIQEMNEGTIAPRFEKRNVLNAHDPTFDGVIQQNEIVTMEYRRLAFLSLHSRSRQALRFFLDCH